MGKIINGSWITDDQLQDNQSNQSFQRENSVVRDWISEGNKYPAEKGRYHLYLAYNCPWAHRAFLYLNIKGLGSVISKSFVSPKRTDQGWVFDSDYQDDLFGYESLHQVYTLAISNYTGRCTVPILFDKHSNSLVSNESAEIIRMLNSEFNKWATNSNDYYPIAHRQEIDKWNELIYAKVNNGVYRAGFANTQEGYDEAVKQLFDCLELIDGHLSSHRYLVGKQVTEADLRLFPTLARFDVAYYGAFKCNIKRLQDFDSLWGYAKELYQIPGVAETVRLDIYKQGYYSKNPKRNPLGIIPLGPKGIDFTGAHDRQFIKLADFANR